MKEVIYKIILATLFLLIMFAMCSIAELISNVITIDFISKAIYLMLFVAIIYILIN